MNVVRKKNVSRAKIQNICLILIPKKNAKTHSLVSIPVTAFNTTTTFYNVMVNQN
jgi:hypothetical protein